MHYFRSLKWLILLCFFISTAGSTYYWHQSHPNLRRKFLSISTVLSLTSLAFIALRFAMINYYDWLIDRKRKRIKIFTDKKVAIIEEVKENEKYKVAKVFMLEWDFINIWNLGNNWKIWIRIGSERMAWTVNIIENSDKCEFGFIKEQRNWSNGWKTTNKTGAKIVRNSRDRPPSAE